MAVSESQALTILERELSVTYVAGPRKLVRLGIGDDAAVLGGATRSTVLSVDACQEGTHFLWEWMGPEDVAHKALHAALSDLPAMGARATAALCHVTLSSRLTPRWLVRFARAQAEIARSCGIALVGGNLCSGPSVSVVTTVLGEEPPGGLLRRDGAAPGDEVWLIGDVGLARAGLLALTKGNKSRSSGISAALRAFRRPTALLTAGPLLVGRARSCMDVSDGLAKDANTLAQASGVRVMIDAALLLSALAPELLQAAKVLKEDPLQLALQGGEDYALLATGPGARRPSFARPIGLVEEGKGAVLLSEGKQSPLRGGFEHGARTSGRPTRARSSRKKA